VEKKSGELLDAGRTGNGSPQGTAADPGTAGAGSAPSIDLPPPPAQLVAALTAFEQATPESFRQSVSDATPIDDDGTPARFGSGKPATSNARSARLKMANAGMGALVLVLVTWALCSAKAATPKEASSTSPSAAAPTGAALPGSPANENQVNLPNNTAPAPPTAVAAEPPAATAGSDKAPAPSRTRVSSSPASKKPCGKSSKPCK